MDLEASGRSPLIRGGKVEVDDRVWEWECKRLHAPKEWLN